MKAGQKKGNSQWDGNADNWDIILSSKSLRTAIINTMKRNGLSLTSLQDYDKIPAGRVASLKSWLFPGKGVPDKAPLHEDIVRICKILGIKMTIKVEINEIDAEEIKSKARFLTTSEPLDVKKLTNDFINELVQ